MEDVMRNGTIAILTALALTAGAAIAQAEDYGPLKVQKTSIGNVLADSKGTTLYTFDKDTTGASACTGECAEYWPPVGASASDKAVGDLTVIKRADGTMQWADHGKPLYTYAKDKAPGDVTGDKVNGTWHAVMPE
jgi:predicted lipoprotein with Yx(FWY)xxD motif